MLVVLNIGVWLLIWSMSLVKNNLLVCCVLSVTSFRSWCIRRWRIVPLFHELYKTFLEKIKGPLPHYKSNLRVHSCKTLGTSPLPGYFKVNYADSIRRLWPFGASREYQIVVCDFHSQELCQGPLPHYRSIKHVLQTVSIAPGSLIALERIPIEAINDFLDLKNLSQTGHLVEV